MTEKQWFLYTSISHQTFLWVKFELEQEMSFSNDQSGSPHSWLIIVSFFISLNCYEILARENNKNSTPGTNKSAFWLFCGHPKEKIRNFSQKSRLTVKLQNSCSQRRAFIILVQLTTTVVSPWCFILINAGSNRYHHHFLWNSNYRYFNSVTSRGKYDNCMCFSRCYHRCYYWSLDKKL